MLVAPGEYAENLIINEHAITLLGDPDFPTNVVIDGSEGGSVIAMQENVNGFITINGFTITGGDADDGGGILIEGGAASLLHNLIIRTNQADRGGAIYMNDCDSDNMVWSGLIIDENQAEGYGGALYVRQSNLTLIDSEITNTSAPHYGSTIYANSSSELRLIRVLIQGNHCDPRANNSYSVAHLNSVLFSLEDCQIINNKGVRLIRSHNATIEARRTLFANWGIDMGKFGLYFTSPGDSTHRIINCTFIGFEEFVVLGNAEIQIVNSILWGNGTENGGQQIEEDHNAQLVYCLVENGEGDNIIDEDPLFADPNNNDYHLTVTSPCIDAGDPDSPDDPDGTRADIGAFPKLQSGTIVGHVFNSINDDPVAGASIRTSLGRWAQTNEEGTYRLSHVFIDEEFELTANADLFADSTIIDLQLEHEDTFIIDFHLPRPVLITDVEGIEEQVERGRSVEVEIGLANNGNYPLEWKATRQAAIEAKPWDQLFSEPIGGILDDSRIEGALFVDDHFYISGSGTNPNQIFVMDRDVELVRSFDQPSEHRFGLRDLAYDGELIWGGDDNGEVFGFDREGNVEHRWESPFRRNQSVAWDSDRDVLWISSISGDEIVACDRNGEQVDSVRQFDLYVFGMAYWAEDPDGYPLYLLTGSGFNNQGAAVVFKVDPENSDTLRVAELELQNNGRPRGCFISEQYIPFSANLINISSGGGEDRLETRFLATTGLTWIELDESERLLEPDAETTLGLTLLSADLVPDLYEARINFDFPEVGGGASIPITFMVEPASASDESFTPVELAIESIYPNPFNSTTSITYSLPANSPVTLTLYDLSGREVRTIVDGNGQTGVHRTVLTVTDMPSGLYFVRLASSNDVVTQKVMLVR